MAGSSRGQIFRLTTFGESHGAAIGGVVDGCPAGLPLSEAYIQERLDRRRPGGIEGQAALAGTARKESDTVHLLSGIFEGKTTGTPIAFVINNEDQRSRDYGELARVFRPGHADMAYEAKYGLRDYRGGGRASARETAARVAGGAIAEALLATAGITIAAGTVELAGLPAPEQEIDLEHALARPFFAAADAVIPAWEAAVKDARSAGDSLGGIVQIVARHVPAGLGEPVFHKLDAELAAALMGVGAVKGVEVGAGFAAARLRGSQNNDAMTPQGFCSNNAGGILGGISSGQEIILRAAVKPIPSISQKQDSVDKDGKAVSLCIGGRHDVCAIPRVVPVLAAMTALVLADALLLQRRMSQSA